jgi:hypothetical protein
LLRFAGFAAAWVTLGLVACSSVSNSGGGLHGADPDLVIPIVGIFFIFGLPVIAWLVHRAMAFRENEMKHLERIEMLRRGMIPGETIPNVMPPPGASRMPSQMSTSEAHEALRKGLTLAAIGLAITIGLSFIGWGPWLIGGLIPLFIGIVQVAFAVLSGSALPPQSHVPPPPQAPPSAPASSQTFEGSYTYRPGATQELRPPSPPPSPFDK